MGSSLRFSLRVLILTQIILGVLLAISLNIHLVKGSLGRDKMHGGFREYGFPFPCWTVGGMGELLDDGTVRHEKVSRINPVNLTGNVGLLLLVSFFIA